MDHVGFDDFYRNEHSRVFGVVVALTGRADLAGDAADEAFARALVFVTGCEVCQPNRNWVVIGTAQDRYVEGLFDGDPANNRNTLAAQAVDSPTIGLRGK